MSALQRLQKTLRVISIMQASCKSRIEYLQARQNHLHGEMQRLAELQTSAVFGDAMVLSNLARRLSRATAEFAETRHALNALRQESARHDVVRKKLQRRSDEESIKADEVSMLDDAVERLGQQPAARNEA
jgi:DNA repair exonuclease SbcCD ATPase subunit